MKTLTLMALISLAGLSPLCAATSIERVYEAEEFSGPGSDAPPDMGGVCPGLMRELKAGDSIRVLTDERGARRDQPAVSFLLDVRSNQLLVVDHISRTYAELSLPLKLKTVAPFQAALDKEARKIMGFSLEGPVREVPGEGIVTYEGKIASAGRTSDVSLSCRPVAAAQARPLLLLEAAVQQVRGGNEWISLLPSNQCLILSRQVVAYLPDIKLTTREKLVKVEETDAAKLVLTPPEGYRKVTFRACTGPVR
ncbi:MAG TPA: hypothetical protein VHU81_05495 [Thermoanaerobaculia bacterium]|nr:hypothetical protein [Thermoanaerobaculia bacterium]